MSQYPQDHDSYPPQGTVRAVHPTSSPIPPNNLGAAGPRAGSLSSPAGPQSPPSHTNSGDRSYASTGSSNSYPADDPSTTEIPLQPTSYGATSSAVNPAYHQPLAPIRSPEPVERPQSLAESDDGTASETDDEFDWDRDDEVDEDEHGNVVRGKTRAKRGRRIWLWLMNLSVWFRSVLRKLCWTYSFGRNPCMCLESGTEMEGNHRHHYMLTPCLVAFVLFCFVLPLVHMTERS